MAGVVIPAILRILAKANSCFPCLGRVRRYIAWPAYGSSDVAAVTIRKCDRLEHVTLHVSKPQTTLDETRQLLHDNGILFVHDFQTPDAHTQHAHAAHAEGLRHGVRMHT